MNRNKIALYGLTLAIVMFVALPAEAGVGGAFRGGAPPWEGAQVSKDARPADLPAASRKDAGLDRATEGVGGAFRGGKPPLEGVGGAFRGGKPPLEGVGGAFRGGKPPWESLKGMIPSWVLDMLQKVTRG